MLEYTKIIRKELSFMDYVPIIFISALTGQRVEQVMPTALEVQEERLVRIPTSKLNQVFRSAQDAHAPTNATGRALKIYYATQVRSDPPTFFLYVNEPKLAHFSYYRFLENQLRKEFKFIGTPIRLVMKPRR